MAPPRAAQSLVGRRLRAHPERPRPLRGARRVTLALGLGLVVPGPKAADALGEGLARALPRTPATQELVAAAPPAALAGASPVPPAGPPAPRHIAPTSAVGSLFSQVMSATPPAAASGPIAPAGSAVRRVNSLCSCTGGLNDLSSNVDFCGAH